MIEGIIEFLPIAWLEYSFMRNALMAVLLICPLFGMMGTMVVDNRMAFFSDALGHSVLTGIALGVLLGLSDPLLAMVAFSLLMAVGIILVKRSGTSSTDTIIGVFSSTAVALGIVILSRGGGFAKYSRYLIGDILSIRIDELYLLALVFAGLILFWLFFFNQLVILSVNRSLAQSRGININFMELSFAMVLALVVSISIQWVGILIISSLLVLPAAAARNVATNMQQYHTLSVVFSFIAGLTGLILSYYWGTATGATIVLCAAVIFFLTFISRQYGVWGS